MVIERFSMFMVAEINDHLTFYVESEKGNKCGLHTVDMRFFMAHATSFFIMAVASFQICFRLDYHQILYHKHYADNLCLICPNS